MNTLHSNFSESRRMTKTRNHNSKRGTEHGRPESQTLRVAIAQFAPVYLDKAASLALAIQIVQDGRREAQGWWHLERPGCLAILLGSMCVRTSAYGSISRQRRCSPASGRT